MQSIFNELLSSSLIDSDSSEENNEDICLISQETLEHDHVKLLCSHKFNYNFIYAEVLNQKLNPNHNEIQKLKKFQFKCPYCRTIQEGVLPSNSKFPSTFGINAPSTQVIKNSICEYVFVSGKKKNTTCSKKCYGKYCNAHKKIMDKRAQKNILQSKQFICTATTKKGTPCKRKARCIKKLYCMQHLKINDKNTNFPTYPNSTCIPVPTTNVVITI